MKIPKIIHYIWLGNNEKPELVKKCIESWKKVCPDYEIIEWNEANFDVNQNLYTQQAYMNKKYAFVTDYIRLYVVNKYGGIYMDTDVELKKPLDEFLDNDYFSGFENCAMIPTAVFGAKPNCKYLQYLLEYYNDRPFVLKNGKLDLRTNVLTITYLTKYKCNIKLNNKTQKLLFEDEEIVYYSNDYFCPKDYITGKIIETENTFAIHHFKGSWVDKKNRKLDKFFKIIISWKIFRKFVVLYYKLLVNRNLKKYLKEKKKKDLSVSAQNLEMPIQDIAS